MFDKTISLCEEIIEKDEHKIIAISGPSPSGKTTVVKSLEAKYTSGIMVFTKESFTEKLLKICKEDDGENKRGEFEDFLGKYKVIVIEDADLFEGRTFTLREIAKIIRETDKTTFIITGIDLNKRLPNFLQDAASEAKLYQIVLPEISIGVSDTEQ